MSLGRPPKTRELIHALRKLGGKPIRQSGSHETWEMPNGVRFPLVVNHVNDTCSRRVLQSVQEALGFVPEC